MRGIAAALICCLCLVLSSAVSSADVSHSAANSTVVVEVPGPLRGCEALSPRVTESDRTILDLTEPSAFLNNAQDVLQGASGAITSAELVSLKPQTVDYGLNTSLRWSNGQPFSATDLIRWWKRARNGNMSYSSGYRSILTMSPTPDGSSVRVAFRSNYTGWPSLFRDVSYRTDNASMCSLANMSKRLTLGPYRIVTSNSQSVTLLSNPGWPFSATRFHRVIVTTARSWPRANSYFVSYHPGVLQNDVAELALHPTIEGVFSPSNAIVELQFAPSMPLGLRQALSQLVNRSTLIHTLFGSVTNLPFPSSSVLFAQGMPGGPGPFVPAANYVPGTNPSADCRSCALRWLQQHRGLAPTIAGVRRWSLPLFTLGYGPSHIDRLAAIALSTQWGSEGVRVVLRAYPSALAANQAARDGRVAFALLDRPTGSEPNLLAESFLSTPFADSYATGVADANIVSLAAIARDIFNPTTANRSWARVDQAILATYVVRPLFTMPSLLAWSGTIQNITATDSLIGLLDSLPNWAISKP